MVWDLELPIPPLPRLDPPCHHSVLPTPSLFCPHTPPYNSCTGLLLPACLHRSTSGWRECFSVPTVALVTCIAGAHFTDFTHIPLAQQPNRIGLRRCFLIFDLFTNIKAEYMEANSHSYIRTPISPHQNSRVRSCTPRYFIFSQVKLYLKLQKLLNVLSHPQPAIYLSQHPALQVPI